MKVFVHINELEEGWTSFPYLSLFAEQIALWSPAPGVLQNEFDNNRSMFNRNILLDMINEGMVTVQGREQHFDKASRNRIPNELFKWDDLFDSEIRRMAKADEHSPTPRVSIAGKQGRGEEWAKEQFELKTSRFQVARQLVTKKQIPHNVRLNIELKGLKHIDDKTKLLMQVFKNHEDARLLSGATITCEEEDFPTAEYAEIVERDAIQWGGSPGRFTEQKVRDFIDLAKDIGPIDTTDKFFSFMRNSKVKAEVTDFIASETNYRDALPTRMENGIVDDGILSELLLKNPILRTFSLSSALVGGASLASEVIKEPIDSGNMIIAAVAMAFAAAPVPYRAAQALSFAPLSEDRYVGPRWPVLLKLGRSSVTLKALRALIADLKGLG